MSARRKQKYKLKDDAERAIKYWLLNFWPNTYRDWIRTGKPKKPTVAMLARSISGHLKWAANTLQINGVDGGVLYDIFTASVDSNKIAEELFEDAKMSKELTMVLRDLIVKNEPKYITWAKGEPSLWEAARRIREDLFKNLPSKQNIESELIIKIITAYLWQVDFEMLAEELAKA